jgi:hypothetical protein
MKVNIETSQLKHLMTVLLVIAGISGGYTLKGQVKPLYFFNRLPLSKKRWRYIRFTALLRMNGHFIPHPLYSLKDSQSRTLIPFKKIICMIL